MAIEKNKLTENRDQSQNGIVTVNDDKNPTPEERDERIGRENDTDRLRSERESVEEANRLKKQQ